MSDLERLNEALDWLDHQPHAEAYTAAKELRAYADLLANRERVWWCETHRVGYRVPAGVSPGSGCHHGTYTDNCRMVSRLLVEPPKEEE